MKYRTRTLLVVAGVAAAIVTLQTPSQAIVGFGASEGYGLSANLSLLGIPALVIPATAPSQGTAPAAYNHSNSVLSLGVSVPLVGSVNTGVLESNAFSDVDGGVGSRIAYGDGTVDDLSINLVPLDNGGNVVTLTATTVSAASATLGDTGVFAALGDSTLENLAINVMGNQLNIPVDPAPNTVLFDLLGVRIVLNEQLTSVTNDDALQLKKAIHITLYNVAGLGGVVSGDIVIAHSQANMSTVPEPGTFIALGAGLLGLAFARRRR